MTPWKKKLHLDDHLEAPPLCVMTWENPSGYAWRLWPELENKQRVSFGYEARARVPAAGFLSLFRTIKELTAWKHD